MKYTLTQKAYEIDFDKIDEGYLYSEEICHAESLNKAKSLLLKRMQDNFQQLVLKNSNDDVTYLTIPVKRCKSADKFLFEDKELSCWRIEEILKERERTFKLNEILSDDSIQYCYIKKGMFYAPNNSGYVDSKVYAGIYEKKDAVSSAKSCEAIVLVPINIIEHNTMIGEHIKKIELETKNKISLIKANIINI